MKKIYLLSVFFIFTFSSNLFANPAYRPYAWLYKLSFDENNEWNIRIFNSTHIDSIMLSSSTNSNICYIVNGYRCDEDICYLMITKDSIKTNLTINPEGDSVSITYLYKLGDNRNGSLSETIIFGNYKNAFVPKPLQGQYITRFQIDIEGSNYHCLSDENYTQKGNLKGRVFNKNNEIVNSGSIVISPFKKKVIDLESYYAIDVLDINEAGNFSTLLYAVNYRMDTLRICYNYICDYFKTVKIKPVKFSMYPDSTIEMDIHLLDDIVAIDKISAPVNDLLKISPNPLNKTSFHYKIETPVKSTSCHVKLMNSVGQEIRTYKIAENEGDMQLPSNIKNGTYILQLVINSKTYSSTKLLVTLE